eukprot:scpid20002/ scgid27628/ 
MHVADRAYRPGVPICVPIDKTTCDENLPRMENSSTIGTPMHSAKTNGHMKQHHTRHTNSTAAATIKTSMRTKGCTQTPDANGNYKTWHNSKMMHGHYEEQSPLQPLHSLQTTNYTS